MKNLCSRLYVGCITLVLAFASPAFGDSGTPSGASAGYLVTNSTSARGWTTVTLIPLKVECERILRSVSMDVYALGKTGLHGHDPANVTCDERKGHFSVQIDMDGSGAVHDAVEHYLLAVEVPVNDGRTAHGSRGGHKDHQHVVQIFHDLE